MTQASPVLESMPRRPRRLRALADMRGIWSLGDQAILSLGNFLCNWMLLRSHAASAWVGNYMVVLSVILFLNNLHMALVTYPLSITSAGISDGELRRRVRRAIAMTLLLAIPESIAISIGTVVTTKLWHLIPLVIASLVLWQLQETVRRALMARLEHRRAIFGDAVSYLGQAAAIWLVIHHGSISIETVFWLIIITDAIALLIQSAQLRLFAPTDTPAAHTLAQHARHHLSLGQWILLANMVNLLTIYSIPWVIRYANGQAAVATYYALLLVLNASNPLLAGVANLITPVVAKVKAEAELRGQTGLRESQRAALKYSIQGALLLFPFFAILIAVPGLVLHIFYKAGSPYLLLTNVMRIFAMAYVLMYISAMINSYLCGLGKSRLPFYGQVANAAVTCLITLPLVARYGITGAAWGAIFPVLAQVAFGSWFVARVNHQR
jgi:O-antigen/teichoic acid export membrane protein